MTKTEDKEKRIRDFLSDLKKISMKHGVVIESDKPLYVMNNYQNITYLTNPVTKAVFPVWLNTEKDPFL